MKLREDAQEEYKMIQDKERRQRSEEDQCRTDRTGGGIPNTEDGMLEKYQRENDQVTYGNICKYLIVRDLR